MKIVSLLNDSMMVYLQLMPHLDFNSIPGNCVFWVNNIPIIEVQPQELVLDMSHPFTINEYWVEKVNNIPIVGVQQQDLELDVNRASASSGSPTSSGEQQNVPPPPAEPPNGEHPSDADPSPSRSSFLADRPTHVPFRCGTKISRSDGDDTVHGIVQSYDPDSQLYLLIYSDGSTETLSHYRVSKDRSPVPRAFLHRAKTDGEMERRSASLAAFELERRSASLDISEKFKVVLRDENGEPRLDENNEPITVIAPHPDMLESKTFLTHADERGEIKRG